MILESSESWRVLLPREQWALFLDVDGSLLELEATPGEVVASEPIVELVERLRRAFDGAVALLSGRSIDDLDRIFYPLVLPCAGVHGSERRSGNGERHASPVDLPFLDHARTVLQAFVRRHEGSLLEDKTIALALHTRLSMGARLEAAALVSALAAESAGTYGVQWGKEVFEIKPSRANKGAALAAFMAEAPFLGRRPVVTGDDLTDTDAFHEAVHRRGVSIAVGAEAPRAMFHLSGPADCRRWLTAWIAQ